METEHYRSGHTPPTLHVAGNGFEGCSFFKRMSMKSEDQILAPWRLFLTTCVYLRTEFSGVATGKVGAPPPEVANPLHNSTTSSSYRSPTDNPPPTLGSPAPNSSPSLPRAV